jgi:hypothetical protein
MEPRTQPARGITRPGVQRLRLPLTDQHASTTSGDDRKVRIVEHTFALVVELPLLLHRIIYC